MAKFLDETGLAHLYEKIKGLIKWQNISGIPSWISSTKPTYTASEVGALPDTTSIPSKVSDLTNDSGFQTQAQVAALIDTKTTGLFSYKGNVANKASLPSSGRVRWATCGTLPTRARTTLGAVRTGMTSAAASPSKPSPMVRSTPFARKQQRIYNNSTSWLIWITRDWPKYGSRSAPESTRRSRAQKVNRSTKAGSTPDTPVRADA